MAVRYANLIQNLLRIREIPIFRCGHRSQEMCIRDRDTSLLAQYAIGASLSSEVRVVRNIYRNNENGYSIYDAEDTSYRLLKLSGYFPTPLRLDGYYRVRGIIKKGKYGRTLQVDDYKSCLLYTSRCV